MCTSESSEYDAWRAQALLSEDALRHNYRRVRDWAAPAEVMAVVKADAYGHGAVRVSQILIEEGVKQLAVATLGEAWALRRAGIEASILIFGIVEPASVVSAIPRATAITVHDPDYALEISRLATGRKEPLAVHVKIDTGLTRVGFPSTEAQREETRQQIVRLFQNPLLLPEGLYTHFADSPGDEAFTAHQTARFQAVARALEGDLTFDRHHVVNSGALFQPLADVFDTVRAGITLYGADPGGEDARRLGLKPVMSVLGRIVQLHAPQETVSISYGRTAERPAGSRLAVVELGYADGVDRRLSNRGAFLVQGQPAPIVGKVCMDRLMLDVSHIADVQRGDLALYFGHVGQAELPVDQVASLADTIAYELFCRIAPRVPRIWY